MFAHLWAPVAAALLVVPQDQYLSLQGAALQQHQAPGIVQMLPVLRQMAELQGRITGAAAGLVATALQVWSGPQGQSAMAHLHAELLESALGGRVILSHATSRFHMLLMSCAWRVAACCTSTCMFLCRCLCCT